MSQLTAPHIFDLPPEILDVIFVHNTNVIDRIVAMHVCRNLYEIIRRNDKTHPVFNYHDVCLGAAKNGYFNIYHWVIKRCSINVHRVANAAISGGQLRFLKYLYRAQRYRPHRTACTLAVKYDNVEILKWLRGYTEYYDIYDDACIYGSLNIVQWAVERCIGGGLYYCHFQLALRVGHLSIVRWFYEEKHFTFDERTCAIAVRGNQLELLKWLRSVGCPWDANSRRLTSTLDNIETVQWAIDNGCP